jgi:hypothetical protein
MAAISPKSLGQRSRGAIFTGDIALLRDSRAIAAIDRERKSISGVGFAKK